MDQQSQEELRIYLILKELEKDRYHEDELKKIFGFKKQLNTTRLYKYIHLEPKDYTTRMFTILKGELVTGDNVKGKKPILRGKYKITAVIDDVPFVYVEKEGGN
jgi:hypothetical protein